MACPYCSDEERRWAAHVALHELNELAEYIREDLPAVYAAQRLALLEIEPLLGEEGRRVTFGENPEPLRVAEALVRLGIDAVTGFGPIHPDTWAEADGILHRYLEAKHAAEVAKKATK
ncbi:MAG: hypothetical protein KatS3mg051_2153 [Anaerolineae bacterium]|nr:MAG: hypothetical protein KatS3mg051_2153 [Anaerolineae bacterium]